MWRPVAAKIRRDEPEGGEAARDRRDDDLRDVELVGERRGVDRPRAPEGDQAELARIVAPLDGHDAERLGHAVVDDARDPGRRLHDSLPERVRHVGTDRRFGRRRIDGEPPAEEMGGAQEPEHHVRVGHRGPVAAAGVAGGAGLRARALGTDPQGAARIDPRDAAAARAHLREIDHRHPDGVAGAVEPPSDVPLPAHLVLGGGLDAAVLDEARLGGGSAHVEGDEVRAANPVAEALRGDDSGGGSGFDGGGRHPERAGDVEHPAARPHDVERRERELRERRFQALEVGVEHRPDVGAHGGRAGPLELSDLGEDLARQEDGQAGEGGPQPRADALLVDVVEEREHEAHRDRLDVPEAADRADEGVELRLVERGDDLALGVDPLGDLEAPPPRDEDRRRVLEEVVEVRARGAPELEHVAEAARRDEGDPGPLRLEQGVGDDGGGVGEEGDRLRGDTVLVHRGARALDDRRPEVARRGRDLGDPGPPAPLVEHRDVGERPADVDPDPPSHLLGLPVRAACPLLRPVRQRSRRRSLTTGDCIARTGTWRQLTGAPILDRGIPKSLDRAMK